MGLHRVDDFSPQLQFQLGGGLRRDLGPDDLTNIHRHKKGLLGRDDPAHLARQIVPECLSPRLNRDLLPDLMTL